MPKKTFEGEGNPTDGFPPAKTTTTIQLQRIRGTKVDWQVEISEEERLILKLLLDRDRTSRLVHGGLQSLLQLTDEQARTLLGLLDRL
jgi:hypothetical protein